jgi:hypothetical protein
MSRFAQFLLKKQLLLPEQLEQALQHQAVYGARLGTNLVELRILTVERLAECLAEFHRIPLPPRAWIERPKRNAVERVTRPLVERIRFIPMRLENNNILHAAVLDPNDPHLLDDLRFATGCKIHPYVLPEIWMHDWLFTLFKLPRGIRHIEAEDADRELEKPAQSYDFQAAQAAIAAKANRIMVPAIVGVVEGNDSRPPAERKTLQGVDRAALLAEARGATAPPQRGGPPNEMQARALGERTTYQGGGPVGERVTAQGQRPAPISERTTAQGAERQPAYPARTTAQGAPARPTAQGAERQAGFPGRITAQGAERQPAFTERAAAHGGERSAPISEKVLEPFPTAGVGASVRPPPISMKSLSELGGRTSLPNVPSSTGPSVISPASDLPGMWEPEAPTSSGIALLREPPAPAHVPDVSRPPPMAAVGPPPRATELSELENNLRQVTDRDQLIEVTFSIASRFARVVALFMVHRGMVQGMRCLEDGESRPINGVLMPLDSASMLTQAANQFVPFRIDPRERPMDARVQQLLSQLAVHEVSLFPVVVKSRAVNLLYASHGVEPLGAIAFGALSLLAEQMGAAYGQLILNRKGGGTAA